MRDRRAPMNAQRAPGLITKHGDERRRRRRAAQRISINHMSSWSGRSAMPRHAQRGTNSLASRRPRSHVPWRFHQVVAMASTTGSFTLCCTATIARSIEAGRDAFAPMFHVSEHEHDLAPWRRARGTHAAPADPVLGDSSHGLAPTCLHAYGHMV